MSAIAWHRVADALPDSDETVLVFTPVSNEPVWLGYLDGDTWRYAEGTLAGGVTHWAEMPEPPGGA